MRTNEPKRLARLTTAGSGLINQAKEDRNTLRNLVTKMEALEATNAAQAALITMLSGVSLPEERRKVSISKASVTRQ